MKTVLKFIGCLLVGLGSVVLFEATSSSVHWILGVSVFAFWAYQEVSWNRERHECTQRALRRLEEKVDRMSSDYLFSPRHRR